MTDLVVDLSKRGFSIVVVTSRGSYLGGDHVSATSPPLSSVSVHYPWSSRFGQYGLVGRAIDYLTFYLTSTLTLWRVVRQGDVIVAKTDPPMLAIPAKLIARLRRAKLINWLQDLFPEIAVELNMFPRNIGVYTITRYLRNRSLRHADMNVVLGALMRDRLLAVGVPLEKICIIHNWADDNAIRFVSHQENRLRKTWGLSDKFVVGYSGNLGRAHEFHTVVDAAERLRHRDDIVFLWVGGGVNYAPLQEEVARRGLDNFQFRPYQDRSRLGESLGVADVHLIVLRPELEGLIVPSKFASSEKFVGALRRRQIAKCMI